MGNTVVLIYAFTVKKKLGECFSDCHDSTCAFLTDCHDSICAFLTVMTVHVLF